MVLESTAFRPGVHFGLAMCFGLLEVVGETPPKVFGAVVVAAFVALVLRLPALATGQSHAAMVSARIIRAGAYQGCIVVLLRFLDFTSASAAFRPGPWSCFFAAMQPGVITHLGTFVCD